MIVYVIKAPSGVGKTSLVITNIASSSYERVEIYVPTHVLAEEIAENLAAAGVSATIILGRSRESAPGKTMCRKPELAEAISRLGHPVFPVICMGAQVPGNRQTVKRCEHFDECDYLKQFDTDARVAIYTHAYLPLPRNSKETKYPTFVVIDESFLSVCLKTNKISRGQLLEIAKEDVIAGCIIRKILRAVDEDTPLLTSLRASGLSPDLLDEVQVEYTGSGASFNPFKSDAEFLSNIRKGGLPRVRFDLLLKILAADLRSQRTESHGVTFDTTTQTLRLHSRDPITRFKSRGTEPTYLVIDANANSELLSPWFPDLHYREIPVERNAYVIQCHSTRGSTRSWVPAANPDPASAERARKMLRGIQELISVESEGGSKKVLVVGPQDVTGNAAKNIPALLVCPTNGALEHFNGLRGVDIYKDFDTVILIGRNQPPISALEDLARALWFDSATPLEFAKDWAAEWRPYRFRDSTRRAGVEVPVHPDPRIQALHEQIREGESTQVIDRLRLIHGKAGRRVIVLSNVPLGLVIDELVDLPTLLYKKRLDRAWTTLKGVLPLNPAWLAETFPGLWPTAAAARTDLRAGVKSGQIVNSIYIKNMTTLNFYEYRVGGQRRCSRAVSTLPLPETMNELTRLLGVPIGLRDPSSDRPDLEHLVGIGGATMEPLQVEGVGTGV